MGYSMFSGQNVITPVRVPSPVSVDAEYRKPLFRPAPLPRTIHASTYDCETPTRNVGREPWLGSVEEFRGGHRGTLYCVPSLFSRLDRVPYPQSEGVLLREGAPLCRRSRHTPDRQIKGVCITTYAPMLKDRGWSIDYMSVRAAGYSPTMTLLQMRQKYALGKFVVRTTGHIILLVDGLVYDNASTGATLWSARLVGPRSKVHTVWKVG